MKCKCDVSEGSSVFICYAQVSISYYVLTFCTIPFNLIFADNMKPEDLTEINKTLEEIGKIEGDIPEEKQKVACGTGRLVVFSLNCLFFLDVIQNLNFVFISFS